MSSTPPKTMDEKDFQAEPSGQQLRPTQSTPANPCASLARLNTVGSSEHYRNTDRSEDNLPVDSLASDEDERTAQDVKDADSINSTVTLASKMSPWQEFLFVSIITLAQFMTQASLGQTLSILHVIGDDFGITNPGLLSWLIAGYSLTIGTFILISGRLGDLFGYKRMLLIGFAWFAVFSMVAGLAVYSNSVLFIFARVLQGIGPSICLPNGVALLGATYAPGRRKAMVFAIFGASAPGGSIVGSLSGGLFALAWWPWTFWSFAITLVCITTLGYFVIPNAGTKSPPPKTLRGIISRCDCLGGAVGVTALVLINFAWNQAGVVGWAKAYVCVCLVLGLLLVPAFFYIEARVAEYPLLLYDALNVDTAFVLGCVACGWATFGIWVYYIWQIIEVLRGASPLLATAYVSPVAISGACAALLTGWLLNKIHPSFVMLIAMLAFLSGTILIATVPVHQVYWAQLFVATLVTTFGMDMSFPAGTLILSNAVKKEHQGIAASLVNTTVNFSISLALGIAGTVEINVNRGGLTPEDILLGFRGALYLGIGLSSLGTATAAAYVLKSHRTNRSSRKPSI